MAQCSWSFWHAQMVMLGDDFEPTTACGRLLCRRLKRGRAFLRVPVRYRRAWIPNAWRADAR